MRATADLLVEIGYSNLTMAAVAERAGTTKTALYRRWSSKAELVHEAAFPAAPTAIETPPGDITADIRAMFGAARDVFTSPVVRAAMPGLIADMAADADLNARVMEPFHRGVRRGPDPIGRRPQARGGPPPISIRTGSSRSSAVPRCCGSYCAPTSPSRDDWVDQTTAIVVHGVVT